MSTRYAAAVAAFLAPPLLLVSDILLILFISTPGLLIQRIALTIFVIAVIGVAAFARGRAQWQTSGGAGLAVLGAVAIVVRQSFLAAPVRPPAVLLPLGLLVMAGALIGSIVSRRTAALIAAGAILFPLAHQSGVPAALVLCDLMFIVSFWSIARAMLRGH